jgi:hypothetical protein
MCVKITGVTRTLQYNSPEECHKSQNNNFFPLKVERLIKKRRTENCISLSFQALRLLLLENNEWDVVHCLVGLVHYKRKYPFSKGVRP